MCCAVGSAQEELVWSSPILKERPHIDQVHLLVRDHPHRELAPSFLRERGWGGEGHEALA